MWKKILPIVAVLILGWIGINLFGGKEATTTVTDATDSAVSDATDAVAGVADAATDAAADATDAATDAATETASDATDAAADATAEVTESFSLAGFSRQIGSVFGTTTSVLSGVTDEDSAKAALPALEGASASLEAVANTFSAAPEAAQGPLKGIMEKGMARIQPMADAALANEGVGSVLDPVIGPMMETLKGLIE